MSEMSTLLQFVIRFPSLSFLYFFQMRIVGISGAGLWDPDPFSVSQPTVLNSWSSWRSRLGPLRHPRTSTDTTSPQISRWEVVVRANLIQPLAFWATWLTFPRAIRKTSKRDVDLAMKSLMCWGVLPEPGYVTKQADVPAELLPRNQ